MQQAIHLWLGRVYSAILAGKENSSFHSLVIHFSPILIFASIPGSYFKYTKEKRKMLLSICGSLTGLFIINRTFIVCFILIAGFKTFLDYCCASDYLRDITTHTSTNFLVCHLLLYDLADFCSAGNILPSR